MKMQRITAVCLAAVTGLFWASIAAGDGGGPTKAPADVNVLNFPATQTVDGTVNVGNLPASQTVNGTVDVGNFPSTQQVTGTVSVDNFPSIPSNVTVDNFPATQTVNGTVNVGNTVGVDVLTLPSMPPQDQPVINVGNWTMWIESVSTNAPPLYQTRLYGLTQDVLIHKAVFTAQNMPSTGSITLSVGDDSGGAFTGSSVAYAALCGACGSTVLDFNPPLRVDQSQTPLLRLEFSSAGASSKVSENAQIYFSDAP